MQNAIGRARRFASAALFFAGLAIFGVTCLLWSIPAIALIRVLPRARGRRVGQRAISSGFRIFIATMEGLGIFRCDLSELDSLRGEGGLVLAPNHPCLLDAVLVVSRLPNVVCIAKTEIYDNWFLGGGARLAGYIRNDAPLTLIRSAVAQLRDGRHLLIFPEGTRTVAAPVNPFKGGFLLMAKQAGAPVQTVFIEGNSRYLTKGWPLFRRPEFPLVYRARLGRRFPPPDNVAAFNRELEDYFRGEMLSPAAPPKRRDVDARLVLIPSYNTGAKVLETVREARAVWPHVWVVVDGSTDGTGERLMEMAAKDPGLRVFALPRNGGKGAAVLHGLEAAAREGFSHVLTMDADGQHPAASIPAFMRASLADPAAMILGAPVFDASAPMLRVRGRRISNWFANIETLDAGIGDSLFGFRVYPIAPLRRAMASSFWMRRFDFDPEAAVRLAWAGVVPRNLPAPVRYFSAEEGGVSHFNYLRDNALLTWMHARLVLGMLWRWPGILVRRQARRPVPAGPETKDWASVERESAARAPARPRQTHPSA